MPSDDHELNRAVAGVLAAGLIGGVALMLAGVVSAAVTSASVGDHALSLGEIPQALADGDPTALLSAGILLLISTPVARVVILAVAFARRREWAYAAVSTVVVAVLALAVFIGSR